MTKRQAIAAAKREKKETKMRYIDGADFYPFEKATFVANDFDINLIATNLQLNITQKHLLMQMLRRNLYIVIWYGTDEDENPELDIDVFWSDHGHVAGTNLLGLVRYAVDETNVIDAKDENKVLEDWKTMIDAALEKRARKA
jgi:hypothetical protein